MIGFIVLIVVLLCLTIIGLILTLQVSVKILCPEREAKIMLYASGVAIVGILILLDITNIIKLC